MTDDHGDHETHDNDEARVTAPMQAFTDREVGVGVAVLVVGLVLTFGLGLALA